MSHPPLSAISNFINCVAYLPLVFVCFQDHKPQAQLANMSDDMSIINVRLQMPALGRILASLRRVETELASMNQKQQTLMTEVESIKALLETSTSAVVVPAFDQGMSTMFALINIADFIRLTSWAASQWTRFLR